jgi:hypothetical protein
MKIITNRYRKETELSAYEFDFFGKAKYTKKYLDWAEEQGIKEVKSLFRYNLIRKLMCFIAQVILLGLFAYIIFFQ